MCSIDLQEVNELFVLTQEHLKVILGILIVGIACDLRSLARRSLAREVLDQVINLSSILVDDIVGEVLHS